MNYIELSISVEPKEIGTDVLIAKLADIGFESFVDSPSGFIAYITEDEFSEPTVKELFSSFSESFNIHFETIIIPRQNWNKEWESNFEPIDVDGKCYIRAPFHEEKEDYPYQIIIEPKMSFGTGHHFTTQLMIKKLMDLEIKDKKVLDMGCGTGVLAILASMKGAKEVTAVDIDDWSCENSEENFKKNNIHNAIVHKGDIQKIVGKIFYTILANINKNVLLADISRYAESLEKSGNILLSGFFDTDVDEIKIAAKKSGLHVEEVLLNNQWALVHLMKK